MNLPYVTTFILLQYICTAAGHVNENVLLLKKQPPPIPLGLALLNIADSTVYFYKLAFGKQF